MMAIQIRPANREDADSIAEAHMNSITTLGPQAYSEDIVADWGKPRDGARYREAMDTQKFLHYSCSNG